MPGAAEALSGGGLPLPRPRPRPVWREFVFSCGFSPCAASSLLLQAVPSGPQEREQAGAWVLGTPWRAAVC